MSGHIQAGVTVSWVAPGGGLRTYGGTIVCAVPAGADLPMTARCYMQGLAWVAMRADLAARGVSQIAKADRYLVRCEETVTVRGELRKRIVYRVADARLIDKQNPAAPKEST